MAKVLLFGALSDLAGWRERLDRALIRHDAALDASSEVAFLPPMSGG